MSATTWRLRRARKERLCTECQIHTIRPGELYLDAACPPWDDANSYGNKWWLIRACLRCCETYGLHSSDTRDQLAAFESAVPVVEVPNG